MPLPDRLLSRVHTAEPGLSAREAARRMRDLHVGALVVVDAAGRPVGVVTDRDLAVDVLAARRDPGTTAVGECMSAPAVTLGNRAEPDEAAEIMRRHRVRRLPIVDHEGRAVGLVSADDLVEELGEQMHRLSLAVRRGFDNERRAGEGPSTVFGRE